MRTILTLSVVLLAAACNPADIHVATSGNDSNPGTAPKPFRTIQHAADVAKPGDTVTVHQGTYRERVDPPRGGTSDKKRIVYQAAAGEKVEITGSEPAKGWRQVQNGVWSITLPNSFFGDFNPFRDEISGNWFLAKGRKHHTGAVYFGGDWLTEASKYDDVLNTTAATPLWYALVDDTRTTITAQFPGADPNQELVEINVRQSVFYPSTPGINFLTVRGFTMTNAATPWAPPTAQQIALLGTHWSKGWIIENNVIHHSTCSGISLGKYGDEWDNKGESAKGYVSTIQRATAHGWNKQTIGHHVVRNNTISHCEQAGIVGSLGAVFSTITGNTIHDIHVRQLFTGAEQAGIKIHAAIDCTISNNHVYHCNRGLWLDWMGQGTRITRNLLHDNAPNEDVFLEVDHGPLLLDNNLSLSSNSLTIVSQGCAYVHNLFCGKIVRSGLDTRQTPFMKAHSTTIAGFHDNPPGDERYYNNIFVQLPDLSVYDPTTFSLSMAGNAFLNGAKPSKHEHQPLVFPEIDPHFSLSERESHFYLRANLSSSQLTASKCRLITSNILGKAAIPNLVFENPDGTPVRISKDYFGMERNTRNPSPGPFENLAGAAKAFMVK